jgi:hypothetical protein
MDIYERLEIDIDRLFKTDNPLDAASDKTVLTGSGSNCPLWETLRVCPNIVELWPARTYRAVTNPTNLLDGTVLD